MVLFTPRQSRFVGALLGCACGDVLGSAVEMQSRSQIVRRYPQLLRDFQPAGRSIGFGCYTDDTEMTLALARSLVRRCRVDGGDCAAAYAAAFTPERGYGRSAIQVLRALQQGADWRRTGTLLFADGSFGNGGAMRIAPLGLCYGAQAYPLLYPKVKAAVWMTHCHPEGIDTALLQARAVGLLAASDKRTDPDQLLQQLLWYAPQSALNQALQQVAQLLHTAAGPEQLVACFDCGVRASASWPPALWAALRYFDDPEEAIVQAVNLGGDADTIGAMTGALVGAAHGADWIPSRWFTALENGPNGRDELIRVALQLAAIPAD